MVQRRDEDDDPFEEKEFIVQEDDVEEFRERLLSDIADEQDLYHPKDVETIKTNYEICRRYIRHKRRDMDAAVAMAKKSLQWRHEFGVNELSEKNIYRLYMNVGCFIPFKKDTMGSQCIIFRTKLHRKSAARSKDMKRYLVFWMERFLYEQNHTRITFVFDSTDATYSSMDLEQITFTIQLFNELYPWALGYVIVYNMPWILKTMWSGIQAMIPSEGTDRFKFCSGEEVFQYIDRDNLPTFMGGNVPVPFRELSNEEIEAVPVDPDIEKRIHSTPESIKFYRENFGLFRDQSENGHTITKLLTCRPESLTFEINDNLQVSSLELTNCSATSIAFKLKSNRIEGFNVKPFQGILSSNQSVRIAVIKDMNHPVSAQDKLLVQAKAIDETLNTDDLTRFWQKQSRANLFEKKLRCLTNQSDEMTISETRSNPTSVARNARKLDDTLETKVTRMEQQLKTQKLIISTLCFLFLLNFAVLLQFKLCENSSSWFC